MLAFTIFAPSHKVEGTARKTSYCFASHAITELMPPDARQKGDKLFINVFIGTFAVIAALLVFGYIVYLVNYLSTLWYVLNQLDLEWNSVHDLAWIVHLSDVQLETLFIKFYKVRNSWRSLIHSTQ